MRDSRDHLTLQQGCRIGVVGGGPAGSFFSYFVLEMARDIGQVELMRLEGSREFCVRVLGEGDAWGEDGLLERDHTRSATARAIGEACVLTIEKSMFLDRMQEDPSFVLKIMRKMSRRIKELEDALVRTAEPIAAASTVQRPPAASSRG